MMHSLADTFHKKVHIRLHPFASMLRGQQSHLCKMQQSRLQRHPVNWKGVLRNGGPLGLLAGLEGASSEAQYELW